MGKVGIKTNIRNTGQLSVSAPTRANRTMLWLLCSIYTRPTSSRFRVEWYLAAERVLATVADVQETVFIFVFLINPVHKLRCWRNLAIDE